MPFAFGLNGHVVVKLIGCLGRRWNLCRKIEEVGSFDQALQRAGLLRWERRGINRGGQPHPRESAGSFKVYSHI